MIMGLNISPYKTVAASIILLLSLTCSVFAQDAPVLSGWKTLHYTDVPLKLTVKNGMENVLKFPWAVDPGMSSEMVGMLHEPKIIGDAFYLTPASPFDYERFTFLSRETGAIIPIDIRSIDETQPVLVNVNDAREAEVAAQVQSDTKSEEKSGSTQREELRRYTMIDLAQYAMQMVYAPDRLINRLDGLTEVTDNNPVVVHDLVPGALVDAVQWKAWQTPDGRFLTVLAVQNKGSSEVSLDPTLRRHSRYEIASTPYSHILAPNGMPGDETALVIISSVSWSDAIALSLQ